MKPEHADLAGADRPLNTRATAARARLLDLGLTCEHPHCRAAATVLHSREGATRRLCDQHAEDARVDGQIERQRDQRRGMTAAD
jgi:hypothetical protein